MPESGFSNDNRWKSAREEFRTQYAQHQILHMDACRAFQSLALLLISDQFSSPPKVSGRVKDREECIKKFELKYLKNAEESEAQFSIMSEISDLIGLRIVCIYESDIEKVASVLRQDLNVVNETDKSEALQIHENQFGYKGLHLDVKLDDDRAKLREYNRFSDIQFEIQVRSIVQDAWSEVDHRLKYKKRIPTSLKRRINRLAALFELADQEFEAIRDETSDLEQEGEQKASSAQSLDEVLTPFNFGPCVRAYFPDEMFEPHKVDGFVDELLEQNDNMKISDLSNALNDHLASVQEFKTYLSTPPLNHDMNSFTQLRHVLYLANRVLYLNLMRPGPMKNFDRWLEYGTVHPAEVEIQKKYPKK